MTANQQNLTNLLRYAEEILKISERVISNLATDAVQAIQEQDVLGLEGVTVDPGDGAWVRFARLREIPAPSADPLFDGWVSKPIASRIFERPVLADSRLVKVAVEVASGRGSRLELANPTAAVRPQNRRGVSRFTTRTSLMC
jgi:hypothetical protein